MTKRTLRIEQEADEDVEAAVRYYRREAGEEIALRFVHEVEAAFELLASDDVGHLYEDAISPRLRSLHVWPLKTFPYTIVHQRTDTEVLVLGIVEAHQDLPEIFRERWGFGE